MSKLDYVVGKLRTKYGKKVNNNIFDFRIEIGIIKYGKYVLVCLFQNNSLY
jgi:hypothetical protein